MLVAKLPVRRKTDHQQSHSMPQNNQIYSAALFNAKFHTMLRVTFSNFIVFTTLVIGGFFSLNPRCQRKTEPRKIKRNPL